MLTTLLLAATVSQPAHVLILGGGKTAADATKAREAYRSHRSVTPAKDYPRILKSDEVKGLNPGFHIVVLGACAPDDWQLDAMRTLYEGSYVRAVEWPGGGALPCPTLNEKWTLGPEKVLKTKRGDVALRWAGGDVLVVERVDGAKRFGRLAITTEQLSRFGAAGCTIANDATAKPREVVVNFTCSVPDCTTPGERQVSIHLGPTKKGVSVKYVEGKYTPGECD